jgi:hypothetical protein
MSGTKNDVILRHNMSSTKSALTRAAFSHDDALVVGCDRAAVRVWSVATATTQTELTSHTDIVTCG